MWTCPKCKELIEDQFDTCWKCAGDEDHKTTGPRTTRPLEQLEPLCITVAGLPGILFFVLGTPTNSADATFRIVAIVIGFVVGLGGFTAIKVYQRRKAGPADTDGRGGR